MSNHIHCFEWDVIPRPNFNGGWTKTSVYMDVIIYPFPNIDAGLVNVCKEEGSLNSAERHCIKVHSEQYCNQYHYIKCYCDIEIIRIQ